MYVSNIWQPLITKPCRCFDSVFLKKVEDNFFWYLTATRAFGDSTVILNFWHVASAQMRDLAEHPKPLHNCNHSQKLDPINVSILKWQVIQYKGSQGKKKYIYALYLKIPVSPYETMSDLSLNFADHETQNQKLLLSFNHVCLNQPENRGEKGRLLELCTSFWATFPLGSFFLWQDETNQWSIKGMLQQKKW